MEKRGVVAVLIGCAALSCVLRAADETPMLKRLLPAEVAGRVRAVPASAGSTVAAGDLLVEIEPDGA